MFRTVMDQWRANQEQKRAIAAERWEIEKREREEDRAAELKKRDEDRAAELEAREKNQVATETHNDLLRKVASVSYMTLVCHEDTWTFMARQAFGRWRPQWTQSTWLGSMMNAGDAPTKSETFKVYPNLPPGRIKKLDHGMQSTRLSGHNLVCIFDALRSGAASDNLAHSARCKTLYEKFAGFVQLVDASAHPGKTTGIEFKIDDSVKEEYVRRDDAKQPSTAR